MIKEKEDISSKLISCFFLALSFNKDVWAEKVMVTKVVLKIKPGVKTKAV